MYYNKIETPQDAIYEKAAAMDNQDVPLEEWPDKLIGALAHAGFAIVPVNLPPVLLGEAAVAGVHETGNPQHCWDFLVSKSRAYPKNSYEQPANRGKHMGRSWYDTGMDTTTGMWEHLSETLAENETDLPESLNEAIYALRDGRAEVRWKLEDHDGL